MIEMRKMIQKYDKLVKRGQLCRDLYEETNEEKYVMEDYCINHVFECETLQKYEYIKEIAKEKGFERIFDIGCAMAHQSEVFTNKEVDYIGIDEDGSRFWNNDKFKFIEGHYPFKIETKKKDLAVSVLCLTWNCYLYEKDLTLKEQCEALSRDFNACLLYIAADKIKFVSKYFKNTEILDNNFVYFSN